LKRSIGATRAVTVQRGLAKLDSPEGVILAFATQAGRTAEDGTGRNSPYTTAFLKHIEAQEEIGSVFRKISADVYAATKQKQLPELSLSLIGEFYLKGRAQVSVSVDPSLTVAPLSEAAQAWAVTKDSTSAAVLEDFVRQFGSTPYGSMARARLQELKSVTVEPVKERANNGGVLVAAEPKRPVAFVRPDAALANAYFFKGGQYVRYDVLADKVIDGALPLDDRRWPNWPGAWNSGINAAVDLGNGTVYFFKGSQYLRYDIAGRRVGDGYPRPIAGNWPGFPASWTAGFDAAINWGNGKIYFFKGGEYLRYDIARDRVDDGFPRPLNATTWPHWPVAWNSGINAAVNWGNGRAYFFKGDQYLRYDISADTVDHDYPKPIAGNWPGLVEALSRGVDAAIAAPGL
jgi:matrix metalloproteinase-14 (membrane-inserted)